MRKWFRKWSWSVDWETSAGGFAFLLARHGALIVVACLTIEIHWSDDDGR